MEKNIRNSNNIQDIQIVDFISIIHKFFSDVKSYEEGIELLKTYQKRKIKDYPLFTSRKIFYSLIIYKFGKELEYPEALQTKARQLILFYLQNKEEDKNFGEKRRKVVKDFIEEFETYKKEDFKTYMSELAVQYNQLTEMRDRLSEEPEWIVEIQKLQDKILDQVLFVKGEPLFKEYLTTLGNLKREIIKEHLVHAYWDMMKDELMNKNYSLMMKNYLLMKELLLEMREDQDTKEVLDESYIQQLLDNDLFMDKTLIGQVEFIYHKLKIYGIPIYDKMIENTKNELIKNIQENGLCPDSVVNVFRKTVPVIQNYIEIIRIYRKRIQDIKK